MQPIARLSRAGFELALSVGVLLAPRAAAAQQRPTVATLDGRVSHALRARLTILTDSASNASLPVAPLVDKALEGASKHADDARILDAVHVVLDNLRTARTALGVTASDDDLTAGVAALRAGVTPAMLVVIGRALPARPLSVPLSVLGALVAEGVPPESASATVLEYARRTDDAMLLALGRKFARAVAGGVPPRTAFANTLPTGAQAVSALTAGSPPPPPAPRPPRP
ncbi:MAG: hypothetical protein ABI026_02500 [Gemmatimonadaceae bacterium]